jgi:hypothetical protein
MKTVWNFFSGAVILFGYGILISGCTTKSAARAQARQAFMAGQNAALQQTQAQMQGITVIGPVQNPHVPWVAGLTLAQALATANYLDAHDPKQIIITRDGESATLKPEILFNGSVVPLEAGDIVELRQ